MRSLLFLLPLALAAPAAVAQSANWPVEAGERLVDLRGGWRFRLGDDPHRANARYDDGDWDTIFVPSAWEDEGYPNYDGFAWYRRTVVLDDAPRDPIVLDLGRIDDVAASYVNGRFVGSTGRFPESVFETAYHHAHRFVIPADFLRRGTNVIAVRVYDRTLAGGLIEGRAGLYAQRNPWPLAVDLSGSWELVLGDQHPRTWSNETDRRTVTVPGAWEPQGAASYDGFAWYVKRFRRPKDVSDLYLVLGQVDDLDEVYLNGTRIGQTGDLNDWGDMPHINGDEWGRTRLYRIPAGLLASHNHLAVRVYDGGMQGGILSGPVGLIEAEFVDEPSGEDGLFERMRRWWRMERGE